MKKLFIMLTALLAVGVFCTTSFAVNEVQMTLTSPVIYKAGCEKAGSTTYIWDESSVIAAGDWWYMDLPEGITLCKNYDYVIAGMGAAYLPTVYLGNTTYTSARFNSAALITQVDGGWAYGPAGAVPGSAPLGSSVIDGNLAFLVKGVSGQRRVTIYVISEDEGALVGAVPTLTVDNDTQYQVKIFDGKSWSNSGAFALGNQDTCILTDADSDGEYGELNGTSDDDVIGGNVAVDAIADEPYVENTLCINATSLAGQYVYTSYASKSDKFTFTGDSQIAHTGTAATIALANCKGDATDSIAIEGGQNGVCWFEYDDLLAANGDYCTTGFENRVLIEATSGAFGDIDDKYFVELEITSPNDGVYFGGAPAIVGYKSTEDECQAAGTAIVPAPTWWYYEGSTRTTTFTGTDNDCAVGSGQQVDYVLQTNTMDLDDYDTIWIDLPQFYYTNTAVAAGEVVTVEVTLNRYPCGTIFSDTVDLGSFVTTCANAQQTTLYFPWLPGTAATGWWGGFVLTNIGATAGTAALTYSDASGAQATFTTATVAAGAQWVNTAVTAADLTDVSGFDMSMNHSVTAVCAFAARGFAFTGNGTEGTGYLANGTSNGVNMW